MKLFILMRSSYILGVYDSQDSAKTAQQVYLDLFRIRQEKLFRDMAQKLCQPELGDETIGRYTAQEAERLSIHERDLGSLYMI